MSNGPALRIAESFERGDRLGKAVSGFATREEQLSRGLRTREYAETRTYREGMAALESRLSAQMEKIEERFAETSAHARTVNEARRVRIERARRSGMENLRKQAQRAKERWMEKLQIRHFEATRNQPDELAAADAKFSEHSAYLAGLRNALVHLQRRVKRAFFGYPSFLKVLSRANTARSGKEHFGNYDSLSAELLDALEKGKHQLALFRRIWSARLSSYLPAAIVIPLILVIGAGVSILPEPYRLSLAVSGSVALALSVAIFVMHRIGFAKSHAEANMLADFLAESFSLYAATGTALEKEYAEEHHRIREQYDRTFAEIDEQWKRSDEIEKAFLENMRAKIERQGPRLLEKNEKLLPPILQRYELERTSSFAQLEETAATQKQQITETYETAKSARLSEADAQWATLETEWARDVLPLYEAIRAMNAEIATFSPDWDARFVENWEPAAEFPSMAKFATLRMDLAAPPEALPRDSRLALPGPAQVAIPLALNFPAQGSLLFETADSGDPTVAGTLNNIILRILSTTPPGKASFTIIDPVGLGQNFAGLMHLSDFEESLINRRIWTQRDQIEARLEELNEHIEKVIQMYLRNEYANIMEYNAQAGSVKEKYHFLVAADFPANFSESAVKRLQSIATSGPQCGVFTLLHWDRRLPVPEGFVSEELKKNSVFIRRERAAWVFTGLTMPERARIIFDAPPEPGLAVELVHKIGQGSIDSNRVEVPFSQVAPKPEERWMQETTAEIKVAIGRTGATKLQYLALGKGTRQHALFAGKTGSGKSTLFHVIITNLALTYSPDQVEFYLIDFKKGVEFKCYAAQHLPHARVVAIESDREFGLSVLQRVDEELKRRGDLFRKLGVQDIPGYKRAGGTEPMPRTLLLIDEFQEFFVQDDHIAQNASLLFDRIVRQGRAFGIHVLLGSQTLGGAYTLARTTLGQMVVRVALQCNEADAYLIMDENNPAPRLLSRPGEGIYNDAAGALEGNSPFQVVWLPDDERDKWLEQVHVLADQRGGKYGTPIVFEGNAPAEIRENALLAGALESAPSLPPQVARCWLGAPNSIKGPTEAAFRRQSGNHLLLVGQREEAALTILGVSLIALAAQYPAGAAKFFVFHAPNQTGSEKDILETMAASLSSRITMVSSSEIPNVMNELAVELDARLNGNAAPDAPEIFVFVHGLQKFKKLRHEDDFSFSGGSDAPNPGAQLGTLLSEGSSHGIHLLVSLDTFNNVNRSLSRKALSEFEMRVIFQMGANDSASLIDSPLASNLGLHRALFYNEHDGYLETFRPYAPPDPEWIQEATRQLAQLRA